MQCWNKYWAWTQTEDYKRQMRAIVSAPDFLDRQLSVDRGACTGDAVADQRLQSARDQCARRQHLGQFLVAVVQDVALGRHGHGA